MKILLIMILYIFNSSIAAQDQNNSSCRWIDNTENIIAQIQNNEFSAIEQQGNNLAKEINGNQFENISPIFDHINLDDYFNREYPFLIGNDHCEIAKVKMVSIKNET